MECRFTENGLVSPPGNDGSNALFSVSLGGPLRFDAPCPGVIAKRHNLYRFLTIPSDVLKYLRINYHLEELTIYGCLRCSGCQKITYFETENGVKIIENYDLEEDEWPLYRPYPDYFEEYLVHLVPQSELDKKVAFNEYTGQEKSKEESDYYYDHMGYLSYRYQVGGMPFPYQLIKPECKICGGRTTFLSLIPDWNGSEYGYLNEPHAVTICYWLCENCFTISGEVQPD
jgi:hypothetical protein